VPSAVRGDDLRLTNHVISTGYDGMARADREGDRDGVQEMAIEIFERGTSIERIAEEGMTDRGEVDSDLMASRVVRAHLDERASFDRRAGENPCRRGSGAKTLDLTRIGASAGSSVISRIGCDWRVDDDRSGDDTLAAREVSLFDLACTEQHTKRIEGLLIARREHDPRGVGIESVEDARLSVAISHAPHLRVASDQSTCKRAALPFFQWVTRHASGLVDDHVPGRLEQDHERQIGVRSGVKILWARKALERDSFTGRHRMTLPHESAVYANTTLGDQRLGPRAAQLRHAAGEHDIEPFPGVAVSHLELHHRHLTPVPYPEEALHAICAAGPRAYTPGASVET